MMRYLEMRCRCASSRPYHECYVDVEIDSLSSFCCSFSPSFFQVLDGLSYLVTLDETMRMSCFSFALIGLLELEIVMMLWQHGGCVTGAC
jgi:hypothetical protein